MLTKHTLSLLCYAHRASMTLNLGLFCACSRKQTPARRNHLVAL